MAEVCVFNIPPWPEYLSGSYRFFEDGEKHVNRICNYFVLIFMFERTLNFTENNKDISVNSGEWYIQYPGLMQEGIKGSPAPVYFYIHFDAKGYLSDSAVYNDQSRADSALNASTFTLPIKGSFDVDYFKVLIDELNDITQKRPSDVLGKQTLFLRIMNHLVSLNSQADGIQNMVQKVKEYLAMNFNYPVTGSDLSNKFHFTEDYITRKMKQYTGVTPWQYVQGIRIEKAKELLNNTDYTLAHIANEIGYGDMSVFYKAFRKRTGKAPGEWRILSRGHDNT